MKYRIIILFLLLSKFCYSQNLQHADSVSRAKADMVLSHFDSIQVPKLLYSIEDKYYYVLLNYLPFLKEYIVEIDSLGNIISVKLITENANTKRQMKLLEKDKKLLKELVPFDLTKYDTEYITIMPTNYTCCTFGRLGYFVVKDTNGNRYGEFRLSMPVVPEPIDLKLWAYIIKKLSKNIEYN